MPICQQIGCTIVLCVQEVVTPFDITYSKLLYNMGNYFLDAQYLPINQKTVDYYRMYKKSCQS